MARDDDDDLYDEEFDFVDEEEDEDEDEGEAEEGSVIDETPDDVDEDVDEYGRPEPAANYVVHIYEHKKLKRTIERPFTPEDAEAFASEYNRTSKSYGRFALAGKNDVKPKKSID